MTIFTPCEHGFLAPGCPTCYPRQTRCIRCGKTDCCFAQPGSDKPCAPDDGRSIVTKAEVDAGRTAWDTDKTSAVHFPNTKRYVYTPPPVPQEIRWGNDDDFNDWDDPEPDISMITRDIARGS